MQSRYFIRNDKVVIIIVIAEGKYSQNNNFCPKEGIDYLNIILINQANAKRGNYKKYI